MLGGVDNRCEANCGLFTGRFGGLNGRLEQALSKCGGRTPVFSRRFRGVDGTLGLTALWEVVGVRLAIGEERHF